jgi:hypothetical protein
VTKPTWKYHPLCLLFPLMTAEERNELKKDMIQRVNQGLDALEHSLLLYDDMLLDGRNRFEVWYEAADENACNGYFQRNQPPTERFAPAKHGTLAAWMKVKSLNLVHRQVPADRKAAIFIKAVEEFPELNAVIQEIKEENAARQKAGEPLAAGDKRGNTTKQVAKLAGVGPTTVKTVLKLRKEAPEKFEEVAQGKTTAKKALKEVKKTAPQPPKKKADVAKPKEIKAGDTVFQVVVPAEWSAVPTVVERTIKTVTSKNFLCTDKRRIKKSEKLFVSLDDAKKEWRVVMDEQVGKLKEAVKEGPTVSK